MPAKKRKKQTKKLAAKRSLFWRFLLFVSVFGVLGVAYYFVTHAASPYFSGANSQCVGISQSKSVVLPGETITATVQIKNTSTNGAYFSSDFGAHLLEFNNESFTNYWSGNRFTPYLNVPPGQVATFSISTRAPSTPGTYPFGWAIGVGSSGAVPYGCTGTPVKVTTPPTASLTVNGQAGDISITKGSALTLTWSSTNGAQGCNASGNWSGGKSASSSENRSGDTASSGVKTYNISCYNQVGTSLTVTRRVTVVDPPTPSTGGSGGGTVSPPPSSGGGSSGGTTSSKPKTGTTQKTNAPAPNTAAPTPDTTPPSDPGDFTASFEEGVVNLSWTESSDNIGVKGYIVERSIDGINWENISGEGVSGTNYTDPNVTFNSMFQYRIHAIDDAGNISGLVNTSVQTGSFEPNITADKELELTSEDGVIKVTIPAGAVKEDAQCSLQSTNRFAPAADHYENITGPYELVCKQADSSNLTDFENDPHVTTTLNHSQQKKYKSLRFYTRGDDDWKAAQTKPGESSFVLGDSTEFAVLGQLKVTPVWVKLLVALLAVLLIIGGGITGLKLISRRHSQKLIEQQVQDYYNKEHGYR